MVVGCAGVCFGDKGRFHLLEARSYRKNMTRLVRWTKKTY